MADLKQRIDEATGTSTVGHEWDGIEELDTPMPRWWLWTFYATIVWGLVYVVLYPAWPLVDSATEGVLGWSSRGELEKEMQADARDATRDATAQAPFGHLYTASMLWALTTMSTIGYGDIKAIGNGEKRCS